MEHVISKDLIVQFRKSMEEDEKSGITIQKYLRDVKAFKEYAGEGEVDKECVILYKKLLMERYAAASVNSMLASLNSFFKSAGWYDCVVKSVKIQREAFRSCERELSREEYYRLLKTAKKRGNMRLYYLMQSICATGIRVGELKFLTVEVLGSRRMSVSMKGKTRIVLLPKELCRELKHYIKERGITKGSIFVTRTGKTLDRNNILHEMKALCEQSGVERRKVFPHNLRHLFACTYYEREKDITHLADLLGHSNINTTRIYTLVSGEEQARKIEMLGLVLREKNKKTA